MKAAVYTCIVHPLLEYASPVWYLYSTGDINQLEAVQRRAARWVCGSRWNATEKCWSKSSDSCLDQLKWPSLHDRQKYFMICQLHSIFNNYSAIPFKNVLPCPIDIHVQIPFQLTYQCLLSTLINIRFLSILHFSGTLFPPRFFKSATLNYFNLPSDAFFCSYILCICNCILCFVVSLICL